MELPSRPIVLKTLSIEQKYPYFFRNENIDDNIYIVQKAYNIENALFIIDTWNKEKYNIGEIEQYIDIDIPYTKYLYSSNTNIKKVDVNGGNDVYKMSKEDKNKDYKILVYKREEKFYISALLKFDFEV